MKRVWFRVARIWVRSGQRKEKCGACTFRARNRQPPWRVPDPLLSKFQAPSSKLQMNSRFQSPTRDSTGQIGVWHLELLWSLEFGTWNFPASRDRDHVFDTGVFAHEQFPIRIHRKTLADHRAKGIRPALLEHTEVVNRRAKRAGIRVYRADKHLILQHDVAHERIGFDGNGRLLRRNAGENENAVEAKQLQQFKG